MILNSLYTTHLKIETRVKVHVHVYLIYFFKYYKKKSKFLFFLNLFKMILSMIFVLVML